jgi:hypothetical protein
MFCAGLAAMKEDDVHRQGCPAPAFPPRPELLTSQPTTADTSNTRLELAAEMAQDATTPTLNETLKQDKAQFEDCTPCRVVGRPGPLSLCL